MKRARNLLITAGAVLVLAGCTRKIEDPAPMQTGSFLTYAVTEQLADMTHNYEVTLRFTKSGDTLKAKIEGPKGATEVDLDLEGYPKGGALTYGLKTTGDLDIGMLYLPAKDRRPGVATKAGRLDKKRRYDKWEVWEIITRKKAAGSLFYDSGMGVLVGWNFTLGSVAVVAKLSGSG